MTGSFPSPLDKRSLQYCYHCFVYADHLLASQSCCIFLPPRHNTSVTHFSVAGLSAPAPHIARAPLSINFCFFLSVAMSIRADASGHGHGAGQRSGAV